ncbi:MAG: YXWGXW repeat-containing protein [Acidobacteriaceae bacterium]
MTTHKKSAFGAMLSAVLLFGVAACHGKLNSSVAAQTSSQSDQGDPAAANNAPDNGTGSAYDSGAAPAAMPSQAQPQSNESYASPGAPPASSAPQASGQYSQNEPPPPPPPDQTGYSQGGYDQGGYNQGGYNQSPYAQGYGDSQDQQQVYAPEPPPPMPEYEQPYCPGPDYIWTPGYWYWSPAGYYWVPGAWVLAPYIGALWTPGYWGFMGGRYGWNGGYWGPYIGFYGGINYGYGYFGRGYEGGYWNRGAFYYNRSVNRVGGNMRHVYARNVNYNNRTRVSYNGGRGGVNARPNRSQMNAARARRFGAIPAQRQLVKQAQGNRAQFANVNKGRPAQVAYSRPVNGGRKAPAARPQDFRPVMGARPATGAPLGNTNRPQPTANRNRPTQSRPIQQTQPRPQQYHPAPQRQPAQQQYRPAPPQYHPQQRQPAQQQYRPAPPQYHPQQRQPAQQQYRPAPPQYHPQQRQPAQQQYRPAPQRQESRPAPQHQQDNRGPN